MQKVEHSNDPRVSAIVCWLREKGFDEAAQAVEQTPKELEQRMCEAVYVEWLYYQEEVAKASGVLKAEGS